MKIALVLILLLIGCAPRLFAQAPLRPGDTVEIRIAGVPAEEISAFSAQYPIDDAGMINLPYINEIKAAGLQPGALQTAIENKLKSDGIYTQPTVTVIPPVGARFVSVGGQVRSPGRVPYTPDLTLNGALNAAGGASDFAGDKIRLTRSGKATVYSRKQLSRDPGADPKTQPGDQIEVLQGGWLGF